eukprot:scaffold33339_cov54-Phaeocystis_antarctica.AAC.2
MRFDIFNCTELCVCKVYNRVEVVFCEVTLLGSPVGRARADTQRARSTTTHGRSRRGGAGGTSEASAGGTNRWDIRKGLLEGTSRRDFVLQSLFKSKGLRFEQ